VTRYLVTGCAGFIGSHLVDELLDLGHEVVGVDAFTDFYQRELKELNLASAHTRPGFSLVEADLATIPLMPLLAEVEGVFHLAARPGVRQSWGETFSAYVRENLLVTQRLFEAATSARRRLVFASSSSVYGEALDYPTDEDVRPAPVSPYGVTKLACEHLAHAYVSNRDADVVCLRYFSVYGPRQRPDMAFARMTAALLSGDAFEVYGTGRQSRDFTFVGDVVAANLAAMDLAAPGAVYNVGGGNEASLVDAIAICERLSGLQLSVDHRAKGAGDPARSAADTTRIRRELGWEPKTSLVQGLAAQLSWARDKAPVAALH
jgi:nucleoside-diphosphate-sugar epimerase